MTNTRPDNQTTIERPEGLTAEVWPYEIETAQLDQATVAKFDGIELERISLAYTDEGEGPTLLLVHDGMCSYLWVHLIERLRDRFRVVTLDFPGSGLSPASDEPVSLETDSRLLESFVDHLELTDITLVVHDLGGGVGLAFATRRPELIAGLALVNTFAWPPHTTPLRGMLRLMGSRPMAAFNSVTNFMARASSSRFGVGRHFTREQKRAFLQMFRRKVSRRRFHALMASAARSGDYLANVEAGLSKLSGKPALTIFGKRNDPFRFQDRWLTLFPEADQMVIRGGYHFPMCDDPDGVAERIAEWHQATHPE